MIVDCHTHINLDVENVAASEHLEAVENVDVCIVLAENRDSAQKTNVRLSEYIAKYPEKMVGFAAIDPTRECLKTNKVAAVTEKLGLKGVVLYCAELGFHPADSRAMQCYEAAAELGLPVFFHNSGHLSSEAILSYAQPYLLDEIARTFPDLKIIIGSMGMPFVEQTLSMVAKHENVYADLTMSPSRIWQVYNVVVAAHEQDVMAKLLFGSGFPASGANQCMETLLGFNKLLGDTSLPTVPRGNIRNIIEKDSLRLLGITS